MSKARGSTASRMKTFARHFSLSRSSGSAASSQIRQNSTSGKKVGHYDLIVVGGGNACGYVCKNLVDLKYKGTIAIVSREPVPPYERPALTKAFLHPPGAKVRARLPGFHTCVGGGGERQTSEWYVKNNVTLFLDSTAKALDPQARTIQVCGPDGDKQLSYSKLVLSTGAKALGPSDLKMANADLGNVFTIREEKETMEMVNAFETGGIQKVVIVGGGYIGMEVAAAAVGWGFDVTMVFPEDQLMQRLFPKAVADIFEAHFKSRGIEILKGKAVKGLKGSGVVAAVQLGDGDEITCDAVVFGVGARLNTEIIPESLKKGSGRVGGVEVNDNMQTSNESIYAVGDIAAVAGGSRRYEHVDFARKSAQRAAEGITGVASGPFSYLPYFYSRIFEYSDSPVVFQFYGSSSSSKVETFGNLREAQTSPAKLPEFGAVWLDASNKIEGMMLCNASKERYDAAKNAVVKSLSYDGEF